MSYSNYDFENFNNFNEFKSFEQNALPIKDVENNDNHDDKDTYPPTVNYTKASNYFPIPNNYIIKTTWNQAKLSKTTQIKHAKGLAKKEQIYFENSIKNFYNPKDHVVLKTLDFIIENKEYHVIFKDDYKYAISQIHQEINVYIGELIPINFIDLNSTIVQEELLKEPDITDPLIIKQVVNATGKGAYQSIKKILEYIIPSYIKKEVVLDLAIPTIYLQYLKFLATCLDFNVANSNYFYPEYYNQKDRKIKIKFEFWKIHSIENWNYTSLIGDDKLRVFQNFNLAKLFDPEDAALIKNLWNGFAKLYDLLEEIKTDPAKLNIIYF
ncbi:hypothetical protein RhiirA4_480104 [Rhizophagus irregularis]|uniref:Uncharacterized protein n=1 Tax=Rhizophagus irregularis TaxID=588596 RepID=A0A2I1HHE7_9GLOM|nr:hypothetical protein RhiirA4_480104 [Rhizophagus irregularis]